MELEQIDLEAGRHGDGSLPASPQSMADVELNAGVGRSPARNEPAPLVLAQPVTPRGVTAPVPRKAPWPPKLPRSAPSWAVRTAVVALALIAAMEGVFIWRNRTAASAGTPVNAVFQPQPTMVPPSTGTGGSTPVERSESAAPTANAKPGDGRLIIRSQPSGAAISIDGRSYGLTPATVEAIAAGDHQIELRLNDADVRQTVRVEPGATVSIVAPLQSAAPATGWVAIASPLELDVFDGGALIGTSRTPRLMLFEGQRTLDLVNEGTGFRETRRVRVEKGRTVPIAVAMPNSTININAVPWAEVWLDDRRLGETPLGNISVPIGPHEVVFRHPELGEKKIATLVKQGAPARVSADMRSK